MRQAWGHKPKEKIEKFVRDDKDFKKLRIDNTVVFTWKHCIELDLCWQEKQARDNGQVPETTDWIWTDASRAQTLVSRGPSGADFLKNTRFILQRNRGDIWFD